MVIDDADTVIAECPQDATNFRRHYDLDSSRITMIPYAFKPEEFTTRASIEHLLSDPDFDVLRHDITFPLYVEVEEI